MELFGTLHRTQAMFWRRRQLELKRKVAKLKPTESIPEEWLKELVAIDNFLAKISTAMVGVAKAHAEQLSTLPTDQLEAQMRKELALSAQSWTAEQWAIVDQARKRAA